MVTESAPTPEVDTAPATTPAGEQTPQPAAENPVAETQNTDNTEVPLADPRLGELTEKPPADDADVDSDDGVDIPESYKDKPWVSKIKSQEDLWKQIDNLQNMVGRKNVAPDFEKATPQEIENYLAQTRPESPDAYVFDASEGYVPSGLEPKFAEAFHKHGLHPHIGNALIKDLQSVFAGEAQASFSKDSFLDSMEESFGRGYEVKVNQTRQVLESNLSKTDREALQYVPNEQLSIMYRLAANLQDAYGISESGRGGEHKASAVATDPETVKDSLRKEIAEIDKRPHSAEERQSLVDKLYEVTVQSKQKTNSNLR